MALQEQYESAVLETFPAYQERSFVVIGDYETVQDLYHGALEAHVAAYGMQRAQRVRSMAGRLLQSF